MAVTATTQVVPGLSGWRLGGALGRTVAVFERTWFYIKETEFVFEAERGIPVATLERLKKSWAREMLALMHVEVEEIGSPSVTEPAIFVGNHISYVDIALVMATAPVVFVAKAEIGTWPVLGEACRRVGTVFVARTSANSRRDVVKAVSDGVRVHQHHVVIFPSGTTTLDERKPWRPGAFKIAKQAGIPIQPFRIRYEPLRKVAYIGRDFLPAHLWGLAKARGVKAWIEWGDPVRVTDADSQCARIQEWCRPDRWS